MNQMTKVEMKARHLQEITLSETTKPLVNFPICRCHFVTLFDIIGEFQQVLRLAKNQQKNLTYWYEEGPKKPHWLIEYGWNRTMDGNMSKLLDTLFGLNLDVDNIDEFLMKKISKKLVYWSIYYISFACQVVMINKVLNQWL